MFGSYAIMGAIKEGFNKEVDVIEKSEIDANSTIEKKIEKTGVIVYER